jgi:DNA modification methylase
LRPYYQDETATIYCGDCRDVLPRLASDSFDVVLTDPPWGINKAEWDGEFLTFWFEEAARLARRMGLMPGVWNLPNCPAEIGRLSYRWTLAAHLTNGMTRGRMGFGNWIPCLVYASGQESAAWCEAFADWCDANGVTKRDLGRATDTSDMGGWWASRLPHRAQIPSAEQWAKIRAAFGPPESFDEGVYAASWYEPNGDCKDFAVGVDDKPDHPSPKPVGVMRWLLQRLGGDLILDPFMGSGTTGVACAIAGKRFVGVEIEKNYCDLAVARIKRAKGIACDMPRLNSKPETRAPLFELSEATTSAEAIR